MTQMSDQRSVLDGETQANCATQHVRSVLARALHGDHTIRTFVFAMMFTGCVIPPSLSVDKTDAGLNSAPAITSVRADNVELSEYDTVNFEKGLGTLSLTVWDTDLDDTLFPRVFVDYTVDDATPPRSVCTKAAGTTVARSSTCDLIGLCTDADINKPRTMQVLVFDRQPLEFGPPAFQAMPEGGLSTSRTFTLVCQPAQT